MTKIILRQCMNLWFLSFQISFDIFFNHFQDLLKNYLKKLNIFLLSESFRKQFTLSSVFAVIFVNK